VEKGCGSPLEFDPGNEGNISTDQPREELSGPGKRHRIRKVDTVNIEPTDDENSRTHDLPRINPRYECGELFSGMGGLHDGRVAEAGETLPEKGLKLLRRGACSGRQDLVIDLDVGIPEPCKERVIRTIEEQGIRGTSDLVPAPHRLDHAIDDDNGAVLNRGDPRRGEDCGSLNHEGPIVFLLAHPAAAGNEKESGETEAEAPRRHQLQSS
jgi:hypothetical protein